MLRAVFLTEVLGAGIYSSVIFGGSMVLANAVEVLGAHVHDKTWGYTEVHPVYKVTFDDESTYVREQDEEAS